jgi:hypothetical protein
VRYAKSDCVRQEGTTKYFAGRDQRSGSCSQGDEVATEGMIFPVEIYAVECLLHGIFLKGGAEVVGDLGGSVELDLVAE